MSFFSSITEYFLFSVSRDKKSIEKASGKKQFLKMDDFFKHRKRKAAIVIDSEEVDSESKSNAKIRGWKLTVSQLQTLVIEFHQCKKESQMEIGGDLES